LPDLDDLVVQLDAPRARDHGVDLLLDPVAVTECLLAGLVAPSADAKLCGVEKLAGEPAVHPVATGGLDLLEVLDRVAGGHATTLPGCDLRARPGRRGPSGP